MEVIRSHRISRSGYRGCVATIGNFDGVHLGHQAVVRELTRKAAAMGLPSVLVTFEPQPQEYFARASAPARLTPLREKVQALEGLGLDRVLVLRFGPGLAQLSAQAFIDEILVGGLGVHYLVVGDDFRFGKGRTGDVELLRRAGEAHGFEVAGMDTFLVDGARVSSTRVREALSAGDFDAAGRLLGRIYRIGGRVVVGDQRGRTIGFPTANIALRRGASPLHGVFAVKMAGLEEGTRNGVANLGVRPTINAGERCLLEVHLFDFARDIYGKHVEVEFCRKLRDEKAFGSLDELQMQIRLDEAQARQFFHQ